MAALTTADLTAIEKEVWVTDNLAKQFDEGTLLLDVIDKGAQGSPKFMEMLGTHDGRYVIFPVHTGPNPNAGVGTWEGTPYPVEGGQSVNNLKYRSQKVAVTRGLSTEVMTRVGGNPQSAINWTAWDASRTMDNCRRRMDYYMHRDGSGLIQAITSAANNVLTLANTANLYVGTEVSLRNMAAGVSNTVWQGTPVAGITNGTASNGQTVPYPLKISAVNSTTITVVYSTNGASPNTNAAANTDGVYLYDQQGAVPFGLDNVCTVDNPNNCGYNSTANAVLTDASGVSRFFGGINRNDSTLSFWQAAANVNCSSAPLSITDHVQVISNTLLSRDTSLVNSSDLIFLLPRNAWWQVVNDLETGKRTMVRTKIVDGKYDAVQYDVFTFVYSFQQPANTGYVFAPKYMFRMITTPWQEVTLSGSSYTTLLDPLLTRPTDKWRNQMFTEQQICANSCLAALKVVNIGS